MQKFFMLILTIAVGILFLIRVPRPQDDQIARLEQQLRGYETKLAVYEQEATDTGGLLPTAAFTETSQSAFSLPEDVPPGRTQIATTQTAPMVGTPEPGVFPTDSGLPVTPATPTAIPGMPAVIDAAMSLSVDFDGCANNVRSVYTNFETMYGVGRFADMRAGDKITVRFFYNETSTLVYEDTFTVTESGGFCRWWDMVPDEIGWDVGSYSFAVQVNQDPPRVVNYTIGILSSGATPEAEMSDP